MKKTALAGMTWTEIRSILDDDPVVMLPMGSMEEHGPHTVTGDYMGAEEVTRRACERCGAYYLPVIPFGYSEYFRGFPGTVSLSAQTFMGLVHDESVSLLEHGVKRLLYVNGHAGNSPLIDVSVRALMREYKASFAKIDLWQSISPEFRTELYGDKNPMGHGGEPITSVMSRLHPDDMRFDLVPESDAEKTYHGFITSGVNYMKLDDIQVSIYRNMDDITGCGVLGDPAAGNAEIGERIMERLADYCAKTANAMMEWRV